MGFQDYPGGPHNTPPAGTTDKGKVLTLLSTGDACLFVIHRKGAIGKYNELGK